jgi:hypothetical protein
MRGRLMSPRRTSLSRELQRAIISLNSVATTVTSVRTLSNDKCTIFVSHSSKDTKLISLIELAFAGREIEPYFAGSRMEGKNPVEKIVDAIGKSIGFFALITPSVVEDTYTRDWVDFEVGAAKAKGVRIFCWIDKSVATNESYPKLLENITDYDLFSSQEDNECIRVVNSIRDKAFGLGGLRRKSSDSSDERLRTEIDQMDQAHAMAEKSLAGKNTDISDAPSVKGTLRKSKWLPDSRKIADLTIDNSYLNQIYETAEHLAKERYQDAQLSTLSFVVHPFLLDVGIFLDFYSALAGRSCTYQISENGGYARVAHVPPDKEIREPLEKRVLKNLPWKESPDWKQFLQISIAKIGPLSAEDRTYYVVSARPWGIEDLKEVNVFWEFRVIDNFSGREHVIRWNGKKIGANNIKQDY